MENIVLAGYVAVLCAMLGFALLRGVKRNLSCIVLSSAALSWLAGPFLMSALFCPAGQCAALPGTVATSGSLLMGALALLLLLLSNQRNHLQCE